MERVQIEQYWISQKDNKTEKVTTKPELKDVDGTFVVKLRGLNIEGELFNTQ